MSAQEGTSGKLLTASGDNMTCAKQASTHTAMVGSGLASSTKPNAYFYNNDKLGRGQHAAWSVNVLGGPRERDSDNRRIQHRQMSWAKLKFRGLADLVAATERFDRALPGRQHDRFGLEPETIDRGLCLVLHGFCKSLNGRMRA